MTRTRSAKTGSRNASRALKDERTRTFTGCRTCRSRHAKCDEIRPECGVCRRLNLACGGYAPRLFWVDDESSSGSGDITAVASQYRFTLFTESERREMSHELSSSLASERSLDRVLLDLDSASTSSRATFRGPFGVFQAEHARHHSGLSSPGNVPSSPSSLSGAVDGSSDSGVAQVTNDGGADSAQTPQWPGIMGEDPSLEFYAHPHDDGSLGDPTMFALDPSLTSFLLDYPADCHDAAILPFELEEPQPVPSLLNGSKDAQDNFGIGHSSETAHDPVLTVLSPCRSPGRSGKSLIPEHAGSLLRYYKEYLEATSSSMQGKRKSPWQVIFMPCALETFSELTLWNTTSHTRLAILSTLLAHSAFLSHRSERPVLGDEDWRSIGIGHLNTAQGHLKVALKCEVTGPRQVPYKELLMAILALVVASLYRDGTAFRLYLLDAERLMRLCEFGHCDLSSSVRILHHMYTHLRVIAESVFIQRPSTRNATEVEVSGSRSAIDTRAFRMSDESLKLGLDDALEKPQELGLRDIHLESPRRWTQTMFPAIYGVPESLMTLVAKTVSLANEKARLQELVHQTPQSLPDPFKALEKAIWSWSLSKEIPSAMGPVRSPQVLQQLTKATSENLLDYQCTQLMTLAIHQALIIYFYRRIHEVSAMLLQDAVRRVLDHLEPCIEEMIKDQDFAPSLAWPAFIAASEAVTPELQGRALRFLDTTDSHGFFFTTEPAKKIVLSIWKEREQTGDLTISWTSVMAEQSVS